MENMDCTALFTHNKEEEHKKEVLFSGRDQNTFSFLF